MIGFLETMRGTVIEPDGTEHRIQFTVSARRRSGGRFALSGVASAPPWLEEGEVSGTLVMSVRPPAIVYHLELGGGRTLDAQKTPSPLAPIESFTFMPVTLRGPGAEVLAEGSMRFDLRELPRFMASWLPVARGQQRQLDARRRAVVRAALDGPAG
jgi:hypothetical protein